MATVVVGGATVVVINDEVVVVVEVVVDVVDGAVEAVAGSSGVPVNDGGVSRGRAATSACWAPEHAASAIGSSTSAATAEIRMQDLLGSSALVAVNATAADG